MSSAMIDVLKEPAVVGVVGAVIGAAGAIVVALINKKGDWAASRRERKKARLKHKLQSVCPHVELSIDGQKFVLKGLWWKPPGTWIFTCRLCGAHADPHGAERTVEAWRNASVEELTNQLLPRLKAAQRARSRYDAVAGE